MQMVQQTFIVLHKTKETWVSVLLRDVTDISPSQFTSWPLHRRHPFKGGDYLVLDSRDKEDLKTGKSGKANQNAHEQ